MTDFHGVFPYLVSPIDPAGKIRTDVLGRLCDDLIKAGVHGLTPLGSTGEFAYLDSRAAHGGGADHDRSRKGPRARRSPASPRPRRRMRSRRRRRIRSSAPTASSRSWKRIFRFAEAGRILFPRHRRRGRYSRRDLHQSAIPALGSDARRDRAARRHPRIGYIKDASTNTGRLLSIINRCGDNIRVFSASAHIPAAVMLIGGLGWMAGPACIIPRQSVELYDLCRPRAGTRRWRFNANCGASTRPSRASTSPPASRRGCRSRATTSAIPCRRRRR